MIIKCPNCGIELELPDGLAEGQKIQCTVCQTKFFLGKMRQEQPPKVIIDDSIMHESTHFWQKKLTWKHICGLFVLVFAAKVIINLTTWMAGGTRPTIDAISDDADKAALSTMLRVADQYGDWIAVATNNLKNTSRDYRNFVFELTGSMQKLSDEFSQPREIYDELATAGQTFITSQTEEWATRMAKAIATCRAKSRSIILETRMQKTSGYYKTRKNFLVGTYYIIAQYLEKYELMASTVVEAGQCAKRHASKKNKTNEEMEKAKKEFRELLVRVEKIEQDIQNINSTKIKSDELEKFMMTYE